MRKSIFFKHICENCNNKFISKNPYSKWCTEKCKREFKNLPEYCLNTLCEKGKNKTVKKLKYNQSKYCCQSCANSHNQLGKTKQTFSEKHKENISKSKLGKKNGMFGKHTSKKQKDAASNANKNKILTEETKEKIRNKNLGRKANKETRKKQSLAHIGIKYSEETKQKHRMSTLNYIEKMNGKAFNNIGKHETELLDKQEQIDHCKIDRNFTIVGYKPDGYCHETNTIYEVYEKHHNKQIEKDKRRQHQIQNHLHCNFIIIQDQF